MVCPSDALSFGWKKGQGSFLPKGWCNVSNGGNWALKTREKIGFSLHIQCNFTECLESYKWHKLVDFSRMHSFLKWCAIFHSRQHIAMSFYCTRKLPPLCFLSSLKKFNFIPIVAQHSILSELLMARVMKTKNNYMAWRLKFFPSPAPLLLGNYCWMGIFYISRHSHARYEPLSRLLRCNLLHSCERTLLGTRDEWSLHEKLNVLWVASKFIGILLGKFWSRMSEMWNGRAFVICSFLSTYIYILFFEDFKYCDSVFYHTRSANHNT